MKIHNLLFYILVLWLFISCTNAKDLNGQVIVAFYNVENLFDTIDTPNKMDEEFTPQGEKKWNTERYNKKLSDLATVLSQIDKANLPVVIGLCEIENNNVLTDLAKTKPLRKAKYSIIWNDGPDERGIDCALLYNPKKMQVIAKEFIPIIMPNGEINQTREIVYVEGKIKNEVFHFFVNHWPSRRAGQDESEKDRMYVASVLKRKVNQITNNQANSNIIIMGDLNDEPTDKSIAEVLNALPATNKAKNNDLVNLMYDECVAGKGSYAYRNQWDMIDNLIVSGYLLNKESGLKTTYDNGYIFHKPFMEFINDKGEMSPNRTYGRSYFGGISDHFPVYLILK